MEPLLLLSEIKRDCGWEHIPYDKITTFARMCTVELIDLLIEELDQLDDNDLVNDAGDTGDEYWRLRTAYSQILAEVGEPAVDPLLRALKRSNPQTRAYAARSLGLIGARRACGPLVAMLSDEQNDHVHVQLSLIEALGELGDPRAVEYLLLFLQVSDRQNRGWQIRMAANALGKIGAEAAIAPLSRILQHDGDWFVRLGAAEGLRQIDHPQARAALAHALKDPDARVREAAQGR